MSRPSELIVTEDFSRRAADSLEIFTRRVTKKNRKDIVFINDLPNIAKTGDAPILTGLFFVKIPT